MQKREYGYSALVRIFVFHLSKANPLIGERTISAAHNYNVVIATIDHSLDKIKLLLVRSWEEFHPNGYESGFC